MWTNYVAGAGSDEENASGYFALGVTTSILAGPGVYQGGDTGVELNAEVKLAYI